MEEDIKILEELEEFMKEELRTEHSIFSIEQLKAIENLISGYKELAEQQNKNIQVVYGGRRYNTEGIILKDYIPKSKVKEKIEELEKEHEKYNGINGLEISRNGLINAQIQKLQELLEE